MSEVDLVEQKMHINNNNDVTNNQTFNQSLNKATVDIDSEQIYQYNNELLNFEMALQTVGAADWYQLRAFLYFQFQWFLASFILLGQPYLFRAPEFNCPDNLKLSQDQCNNLICYKNPSLQSNNDYVEWYPSVVKQWNLICDRQIYSTVGQSLTYAGSFIGFFVFSFVADKWGRKHGLFQSWFVASIGVVLMCFTYNYWLFVIGLCLAGMGVNPAITIQYSFLNEHSLGKFREYTAIAVQISYGIGELVFVLCVYLIQDWWLICVFVIAIPILLMNLGIFIIYESPKFLHQKNPLLAADILNKIAKVNKRNTVISIANKEQKYQTNNDQTFSVYDLFRYRSLRMSTWCAAFIFLAIQFIYYGVQFTMSLIGFNLYITAVCVGVCETLSYATTDFFIPKLKRKKTVLNGLAISSLLSFVFIVLFNSQSTKIQIIEVILASLLRFCIVFTWTVVYIYIAELFPTQVRSLALGFTSSLGTIGSFSAPFLVQLFDQTLHIAPQIALGIIGAIACFHVFFLEETKGKEIRQCIKELEQIPYIE